MTTPYIVFTIAILAIGNFLTRAFPFIIFRDGAQLPSLIAYLAKVLPYAIIGMLVVFCFKDTPVTMAPYGAPELIATLAIIVIYKKTRQMIYTIGGGLILYMFLVQIVFPS